VSAGVAGPDLDDQVERTLLAWRRTALSLVAAGLLVGHLAVADAGRPTLVLTLSGIALVVGFVWLGARSIGVTGLVLVAGVALLGAMALVSLVAR
jgi:uncharacterized membrane protein YidH (DUF202 family)